MMKTSLTKSEIAARIPHNGLMCLLECVTSWDNEKIQCEAINHREIEHPLRQGDILETVAAIEYAAQAMAIHGALIAEAHTDANENAVSLNQPKVGYLVSVRDVTCHVAPLESADTPLVIMASRLLGDATQTMYAFQVHAGKTLCAEGSALVLIDANVTGIVG
jgi:predicted hotdog family 3-hydroxylacyl-ACP dehydratase